MTDTLQATIKASDLAAYLDEHAPDAVEYTVRKLDDLMIQVTVQKENQ